ncbi:MAG: hypothetical protein D4R70_02030 [Betaproteobacteria bacterium]|nr:MAG: hypothetical protein D4R70_02030 [Betaproteobacteria bacterium]
MKRFLVFIAPIVLAMPAHAVNLGLENWGRFESDFEEEAVTWQEMQAQLPAYPKAEHLVAFAIDGRAGYRFAVDTKSLSVGADGVTRYSVVIDAPAGARTVNFEALRCPTGERKIYAFGRPDGTWSRNRAARWEIIKARVNTDYHRVLFYEYLCAGGEGVASVPQILERLRRGGYRTD